jgi:hypothetical protein
MRTSAKLTLAALAAALLLASAVSSASATRLSSSNQNLRLTFTSLEFVAPGVVTIRCQVTLEGSFHTRTIAKVARSLVGSVTKAAIKGETCANGSGATFNGAERYNGTTTPNTLPWHLTYESFSGTLPNITALQALVSGFRTGATVSGLCTGQYGSATDNITLAASREASGGLTGMSFVAGSSNLTLIRRDAGLVCPATASMSGTGSIMLLGTTNRVSITLI